MTAGEHFVMNKEPQVFPSDSSAPFGDKPDCRPDLHGSVDLQLLSMALAELAMRCGKSFFGTFTFVVAAFLAGVSAHFRALAGRSQKALLKGVSSLNSLSDAVFGLDGPRPEAFKKASGCGILYHLRRLLAACLALFMGFTFCAKGSDTNKVMILQGLQFLLNKLLFPLPDAIRSALLHRLVAYIERVRLAQMSQEPIAIIPDVVCQPPHRPSVVFVGQSKVGKSSIINCMLEASQGDECWLRNIVHEAKDKDRPTDSQKAFYADVAVCVVVCDTLASSGLQQYFGKYVALMTKLFGHSTQFILVCNKTDITPCCLPLFKGIDKAVPVIAISAKKRTNLKLLTNMIRQYLFQKQQPNGSLQEVT